ncbi:E3 ubiquitin-protein ligase Praja-2-like [Ruditapes philippinarum]|uniref:E3 ubiquitin-protein ligase Praja-2-like n=1 Tax=Ruditapes philippinarum TaxID=129788 RepID=UPI00295C0CE8|nr:E3 ubiquitin-protein ligase Praja-2-like [Ruditapes philippinarum]
MVEDFENTLEDPFNVKSDSKIDLCSGLMDLVREIDIPFIDEDGETKFDNIGKERSARQRDVTDKYSGVMPDICDTSGFSPDVRIPLNCHVGTSASDNSERLSRNCIGMLNCSSGTREARTNLVENKDFYGNIVGSPETSFEDDPDYPGMRTLNDSFNRLLGDDDTDTSTDSSVLPNFMQRSSRSDESGSRSKSSDDSIEADDEFECECEHCQLLRQHSYGTSNLDLLPPRLYTEDMGFPYDLESSASGQTDTESSTGFRSAMFLEDYDFLLDRSNNELDWLIVDSRPLSLMLEDVIQQMLAVQPELLSEQAAPPAPQIVIENLPTIPLTLSHIDQHPSCPICLCLCEVEELMDTVNHAQHIFHPICIQAWLIKSGTCPVCRAKLNKYFYNMKFYHGGDFFFQVTYVSVL